MLYSRDIPTGWLAIFRGGWELELKADRWRPEAVWYGPSGRPVRFARWGDA